MTVGLSALALSAMASPIYIAPKGAAVSQPIEVKEATQVGTGASVAKDTAQGDDGSVSKELQSVGDKAAYEKFNGAGGSSDAASRLLPTVNKKTAAVIVRGWDPDKKAAIEARVKEATDKDENIASAEVDNDKIEVQYRRPVKLFGFIPVAYYHAFTVDGKGNIAQGHPWWLIFATGDATAFSADVQADFRNNQSGLRWIKTPTELELQIQRFSALIEILKTRHDASQQAVSSLK